MAEKTGFVDKHKEGKRPQKVVICRDCAKAERSVLRERQVRHRRCKCKARNPVKNGKYINMAEKTGFEPAVPCDTLAFQAGTLDHSDTSPLGRKLRYKLLG